MSVTKDVRVYGNQYGTWVEVKGALLLKICAVLDIDITEMSIEDHEAIGRFLDAAIDFKAHEVLGAEKVAEIRKPRVLPPRWS